MANGNSLTGNCLWFYWWLRDRVIELETLESIVYYVAPEEYLGPALLFFAAARDIPRELYIEHGWLDYLNDGPDPSADAPIEPRLPPRVGPPIDYDAEYARLMLWLDSDDDDAGAPANA